MDESYANLPTSHLLGSVPAAVSDDKRFTIDEVPQANMQIFPPTRGTDRGQGYPSPGTPSEFEQQPTSSWKGVFSISSYVQYFNVDTDIVLNRMFSSLYPTSGDFFSKIDVNPDLFLYKCKTDSGNQYGCKGGNCAYDYLGRFTMYGLLWISTTLVFMLASLGNCATYLMDKHTGKVSKWSFDVGYVNVAAGSIYGFTIVVPVAYYFLLQYLGSTPSLIRLWCMWGNSLFIFLLSSFLLVIPFEFLRWIIILLAGATSACFVALNLKSYIQGNGVKILLVSSVFLQMALAIFIKVWFFG